MEKHRHLIIALREEKRTLLYRGPNPKQSQAPRGGICIYFIRNNFDAALHIN